jgi:hypothetical protein
MSSQKNENDNDKSLSKQLNVKQHIQFYKFHYNMLPEPYSSQESNRLLLCKFVWF